MSLFANDLCSTWTALKQWPSSRWMFINFHLTLSMYIVSVNCFALSTALLKPLVSEEFCTCCHIRLSLVTRGNSWANFSTPSFLRSTYLVQLWIPKFLHLTILLTRSSSRINLAPQGMNKASFPQSAQIVRSFKRSKSR